MHTTAAEGDESRPIATVTVADTMKAPREVDGWRVTRYALMAAPYLFLTESIELSVVK
jgi:hypothetical protein